MIYHEGVREMVACGAKNLRCGDGMPGGNAGATAAGVATLVSGRYLLAPVVGLAVAYGILWQFGHMLFEGNVPASLAGRGVAQRVATMLRSMCCDFLMGFRALTGRLRGDFERYGITPHLDRPE